MYISVTLGKISHRVQRFLVFYIKVVDIGIHHMVCRNYSGLSFLQSYHIKVPFQLVYNESRICYMCFVSFIDKHHQNHDVIFFYVYF